jgi:hypothetical protein
MKKQIGIWIDASKAILVTLFDGNEHVSEIVSEIDNRVHHEKEGDKGSFMGSRHINNERKLDERKKHQINHFLEMVTEQMKSADELYIFGPANIKLKLKQKIETDEKLISKLKAVETAKSLTLNQVISHVKDFFIKQIPINMA